MSLKLFILFLFSYTFSIGQTWTVRDQKTKEPLEFVNVYSNEPYIYNITNSQGQINLREFKNAKSIYFQLLGYKLFELDLSKEHLEVNEILLTPSVLNMDEIVISATRWNQTSDNVPAKVISISAKEVQIQNPQTAADLLATSGEVFIQKSQQGGGSPMIRGFSTNRLLYAIDGVRMNTAIFRSGNLHNVISLDPFAMQHTEVLFGPGSVIYGSDAIGGVMSFQTLEPSLSVENKSVISGKALSRYATANQEKTAHFDFNLGWKKWAMTTSITSNTFEDLVMGSHGPDDYLRSIYVIRQNGLDIVQNNPNPKQQTPSGYSQFNLMQKFHFVPNKIWNFQYGFHYSETSDFSRYDRHLQMKNNLPKYGEWYYGPQKWQMNLLKISNKKDNSWYGKVDFKLAQQYFEESRISRKFNNSTREIRTEKVNAWSINLDLFKPIASNNKLIYGLEWVFNDVNSFGSDLNILTGYSQNGPSRYPKSDWSSWGAYLTDQYALSKKLNLQAGIRYNYFTLHALFDNTFYPFPFTKTTSENGALTGSLGMVLKPRKDWEISVNTATAFRFPNVDDMGKIFDSEPGSVVVPNPDLKSEYAYNAEIGIAKMFGQSLKIDVTSYFTYLDNAMVRRDFTLDGATQIMYDGELSQVQAIQNASFAKVYGVQAGFELKLPSGFGLSADYNYQKGTEEMDNGETSPSRHAPPAFGNTKLSYNADKLNLQLYAQYSAQMDFDEMPKEEIGKAYLYALDTDGNPYTPDWYTLNFKSNYQFTSIFNIGIGIENLTDQRYRPYSSGMTGAGRNFIFSVKAQI